MDDTSPEVKKLYHEMWMKLPEGERLIRTALMFNAVRDMVIASLPKDLPPDEFKRQLYQRIYGEPLPEAFFQQTRKS